MLNCINSIQRKKGTVLKHNTNQIHETIYFEIPSHALLSLNSRASLVKRNLFKFRDVLHAHIMVLRIHIELSSKGYRYKTDPQKIEGL